MSDESDFDLAEILADRERQTAIDAAKEAVKRSGARCCDTCRAVIPDTRRRAMPSATRCMPCQIEHEALEKAR